MLACMTLGIGTTQAQSNLMFSKDADFTTEDREFDENDTIYLKVEATDVDFSSVRFSKFTLIPRTENAEYKGEFVNNFDGTYTAEILIADLDLVDHLWNWDGLIEDAAGNSFETRILLRIGDPGLFSGFEVRAVVQSTGSDFFVLKGHDFFVDDQTEFVFPPYQFDPNQDPASIPAPNDGPTPATFGDVQEGFTVRVKVETSETGELNARRVEIHGPPFVPGEVNLTGRVESIDQEKRSFVVRDRQVFVNEYTQVGNDGETLGDQEIPDWLVGRKISIYGEFQDDDTILAHFVHVAEGVREELEVRGVVEAVSDNEVVVQGFKFAVLATTDIEKEGEGDGPDEGKGDDGNGDDGSGDDGNGDDGSGDGTTGKASLNDIDPGLIIRVFAVVTPDGVQVAERIAIESGVDNGVRISGAVEALTEEGFSVRGWTVAFTEYTQMFNANFENIPFEELAEGQLVLIFGEFYDDGVIKAHHIEYRRQERDEFTLFGPITAIDESFVTIWDIPFSVTDNSVFESNPGEFLTLEDLSVGQLVEVVSVPDATGALNIERLFIPQGFGDAVRLSGELSNFGDEGFEVLGKTVLTMPETQYRDRNYEPLDVAAFEEGVAVQVFGHFNPDGTVNAYEVMLTGADREEIELWGVIEAVNGDIISVGGVDFYVGENSKVFVEGEDGGEERTPADLVEGDLVSITGVLDEKGTPFIEWVFVPRQEGDQVRITGEVSGSFENGMVLWGQEVLFTEFTQFYTADYQFVGPEAIVDGLNVDVFGTYDDFGVIQADVVEIRGENLEELSITGRVESFDGVSVVIAGTAFLVTDNTQIYDNGDEDHGPGGTDAPGKYSGTPLNGEGPGKFAGVLAGIENLEAGVDVEVFGNLDADGVYVANVIHIFDEGDKIRFSGSLETVDASSLVLQGRLVQIGPETYIQNENFEQVALESLVIDQNIEVYGEIFEDGSVQAHSIVISPGDGELIELWGEIESVQGDLVVVHGTAFVATEFTFVNNDKGDALSVADLAPGLEVNIRGDRGDDGVVVATDIYVSGDHNYAWMNGEVQFVGTDELQVQGRTIVTGPETSFFNAEYTQITLLDVQEGQSVFVSGEIGEDGVLMAYNVEVRGSDFSELQVFGPLTSAGEGILEVNGRTYQLTEETYITGPEGIEIPLEELTSGQFVSVIVVPGEEGAVVAKVYVETNQNNENLRMRGAIQEIAGDGFVMQGRLVVLDEETMVVGDGYEPIPFESLEVGQVVTLFGSFDESGNVLAYKVETQKDQLEEIEFRGVIADVFGELFIIRDTEFYVDVDSYFSDDKGFPVDFSTLTTGTIVDVVGSPAEQGGFSIVRMHVGAGDGDRHINISGQIANLDVAGGSFEIQDRVVRVEDFVEVLGANFDFIRFADLEDGMSIRVFGQYEDDGGVHAYRIEVRSGEGLEVEFRGRVEVVSDEEILVRGLRFLVSANTYIDDGQGQQLSVADLQSGQVVSIVGAPGKADEHIALRIHVSTGNEDRSMRVSGRLVEVDGGNRVLVVRNHVININPEAEIVGDTYERIAFEALTVGHQVSVWGWLHEDGKIEGFRVELRLPNKEDFQIVGVLSDIEDRNIFVNGVKLRVPVSAFVGAPEIGRLAFDRLFPGMVVHVEGATGELGELVADKVQVYGLDERESIEFIGSIANLGNDQFDIGTIGMAFDTQTFLLDGNDQPIVAAALQEGFNVEAFAFGEDDDLSVRFMRVFDIVRDERSVLGRVESLTATTFTIREIVFTVTDETVFLDPLGDPMEFADVTDRMRVDVKAVADGSGVLVAREVQAKPRDRKLTGTVTDIQGDYLVVAGLTITIDPMTAFLNGDEEEISQTDIVAGQTVNLTVTLGPGGQPLATEIRLLPRIEDEVVLNGTVEAVLDDLIVVLGRRFQVIANTRLVDENDNPVAIQSYSVGDAVRIRALLLAGDNLVALRVRKLDAEASDIKVEGPIVSVSASTLEVMGIFFFINESSEFYDLNRNQVTVNEFAEGQTVSVIGEGQANGTVVVTRVGVQNVSLTSGESAGITDGEFSMFGNDYTVDENTMVLGDNNVQLTLDDVEAGQFLEVRGVGEAEGGVAGKNGTSILVSKIKIIDAEGSGEYELEVDDAEGTATEGEELPEDYALFQNYPNPFNPITTIRFSLPVSSSVTLKVFDITGREIQTIMSNTVVAGTHEVQWNGRNGAGLPVASGVYLYRLEAGKQVITRRMVLLK